MSQPILGYWDIRGYAQPIRLLLTYSGVDFVDKRYQIGPAPDFDRSQWLNEKFNLGLDFPNLPYYIDGDMKMTQTFAILRYLGRKYKLNGSNDHEEIRISMAEQQTKDMMAAMIRVCYDANCDKLKPDYLKSLPDCLKLMSKFVGEHAFVAGANISYVDFYLYEYLCRVKVMVPEVFGQFENLKRYVERMESLPRVSDYIKKQQPKTFNAPTSKWNASYA
uniref:Glutathione S-transferase n=1 Tax=Dermatophagoides pteronyssinus TaxID=6956 RepID=A0A6P6YIZ7_DERPT|nr:glutathione S-transferase [Dermatophagoides pteronyssinus]